MTWLQTLGGSAIDLCDPKPEQIDFRTIARVLSRLPRFGGHTNGGVLSVAQHCIEGAAALKRDGHSEEAQRAFLLHDAHEAYIGDIATPVALALAEMAARSSVFARTREHRANIVKLAIRELKRRVDVAIHEAAGITYPLPPDVRALVHEYDLRMCMTERNSRLDPPPREWDLKAEPIEGCDLWTWRAETVEAIYIGQLREMGIEV